VSSYKETLDWMFSKLPMYQRVGAAAYRPGLEAMKKLDAYLNHPHEKFKSIHIGGTNGKGSTSHMLASVLQEAGYKTGLYTSPHLLDYRERIKINGAMIPEAEVVDFIEKHKPYFEEHKLSFFEMTVGMAFSFFEKENVDFAIIEVGLGGRLDASNIIKPILSIITNIGLDHTQFLGTTRPEIANEKAGIIKEGVPVVIGEQHPETEAVFRNKALNMKAPIFFVKNNTVPLYESDLKGSYQKANLQTTFLAIQQLNAGEISEEVLKNGLSKVVKNTHLMGRWQTLSEQPKIIADVGHNKEGLEYIAAQLKNTTYDRLHLVMGFVKGRAIEELIALFPAEANFYISTPNLERGYPVKDLKEVINERENKTTFFDTIPIAFESAKVVATPKDLIFVCGSTFVVAEILAHLKENKINL